MGKASSNKKVARAAKAGGGRARAAGERNILFPTMLAAVVVLGTLLVVYARDERIATAREAPLALQDHWHSAYGIYVCDEFLAEVPEFMTQRAGNHTHGDGLIHVEPVSDARAGTNATLTNWFLDGGEALGGGSELTNDTLGVPGGETYVEGEDSCDEEEGDPIVQVAIWDTGFAAAEDEEPDRVIVEDFGSIRFEGDGMVYTVAFAPRDADLPPPTSLDALAGAGGDGPATAGDPPDAGDATGSETPTEGATETEVTTETEATTEAKETEGEDTTSSSAPTTSEAGS